MDINERTGAWDYTILPPNIRLGEGCFLEDKWSFRRFRSVRDPGLILGNGVQVYAGTALTVEPQGMLVVGDDSILVGAVFWCADQIRVGKRVVISHNVMIADSDFHPRDPELRRQDAVAVSPGGDLGRRPPLLTRPVTIEDDVLIGIHAVILKGVHVGAGARIHAGAVVTSSVPAGVLVAGNPARIIGPETVP